MSIYKSSRNYVFEQAKTFPASRKTDPATSHQAEADINLGSRQKQARMVLKLLAMYPNRTARELSNAMLGDGNFRVDAYTAVEAPRKRLNDLKELGLAEQGETRKCRHSGKKAITWHITPKGERELSNV